MARFASDCTRARCWPASSERRCRATASSEITWRWLTSSSRPANHSKSTLARPRTSKFRPLDATATSIDAFPAADQLHVRCSKLPVYCSQLIPSSHVVPSVSLWLNGPHWIINNSSQLLNIYSGVGSRFLMDCLATPYKCESPQINDANMTSHLYSWFDHALLVLLVWYLALVRPHPIRSTYKYFYKLIFSSRFKARPTIWFHNFL